MEYALPKALVPQESNLKVLRKFDLDNIMTIGYGEGSMSALKTGYRQSLNTKKELSKSGEERAVDIRLYQHIKIDQEVSAQSEDEEPQDGLAICEVTKEKNKKPRRRNRKKNAKSAATEGNERTNPPEAVPSPGADRNTPNCIKTRDFMTLPPHPLYNPSRVLPYPIETQHSVEGTNTEDENGSAMLLKKVVEAVMEENAALKSITSLNKQQLQDLKMQVAEDKITIEKLNKEVTVLLDTRKGDAKELAMLTEKLKRLASRWDSLA
ncbi:hypothetical protein BDZ45DRAFT_689593 [Acephala macrosclerotiorum]|nr:hypothetical protein BDZ45DRAFT_689593 [Acephala macrosclerotiorum]